MAQSPPAETSPSPAVRTSSRLALPALLLCVAWVLGLAGMVLQTANPLTLNRRQFQMSTYVIEAEVLRLIPGEVQVQTYIFSSGREPEKMLVRNLDKTPVEIGKTYLLPLAPARDVTGAPVPGLYDVTPTGLPDGQPLIYPATEEAGEQARELLNSMGRTKSAP